MKIVKKTAEYTVYERRDGRHAVKTKKGQPVNGDEKIAILTAEGFLKAPEPKAEEVVEEAPAEEAPAEASADETEAE